MVYVSALGLNNGKLLIVIAFEPCSNAISDEKNRCRGKTNSVKASIDEHHFIEYKREQNDLASNTQISMLKFRLWQLRKSLESNSTTNLSSKRVSIEVEQKSTRIINLAGYVILFLVLLDRLFLLASSQLFDPNWAYNTAGNLVDNVWGLLLGTLLIFYRRDQDLIAPKEFKVLSFLSWFILFIGIGYFLITPIIVGNAFRIYRSGQAQIISQVDVQKTQTQQYAQQLEQVQPEQLSILLQNYQQQNSSTEVKTIQQLKAALVNQAKQTQVRNQNQLETQFKQQTKTLIKSTTKWLIGAIISGLFFILTWKYTKWTRAEY